MAGGINFRSVSNIRELPDIRRGQLYPKTILSQYDHSRRMLALLSGFESQVDPYYDIQAFYDNAFNPKTAIGWGLDVWGRIVGIGRVLELEGEPEPFGFLGSGLFPFSQRPFYSPTATTSYSLSDEAFRLLIFMKAGINITDGTLPSLNRILNQFFGSRGRTMVLHVGTMHIRFLFRFLLTEYERAMFSQSSVLPAPAGVGFDFYEVPEETFGFFGSELQNFNNGNFSIGDPNYAYSLSS